MAIMKKQAFYKKILNRLMKSKRLKSSAKDLAYGAGGGTAAISAIGGSILAYNSATKDRYLPKGMLD